MPEQLGQFVERNSDRSQPEVVHAAFELVSDVERFVRIACFERVFERVQQFYEVYEMSDGLSIVPPTKIKAEKFLGYRKGSNGLPEIVPEEAEIVRKIYRMFISGRTVNYIAEHLTQQEIPTPRGKQKWQSSTVESILTNEKYKGAALLQKKFTVDFLNKKMKVNEGEVPQYYVEHSHPPIIEPAEWERVQQEMARRKSLGKHCNSLSPFSSKIVCGDCGAYYGAKVWHSTDKYRRTIWQCNNKFSGDEKCGNA